MASLIQVRDLLALRGRMEAAQISQTLNTPQPMINAMLQQLESMGKAVRIQEEPDGCLSGSCKAARKEKPVCASGGRCVNLAHRLFGKPGMRLHPGFLRAAFHKMQLLQHGVVPFESISQG